MGFLSLRQGPHAGHRYALAALAAIAVSALAGSGSAASLGFADVVVEFFDSGNGTLSCPEGQGGSFPPPASTPTCVSLSVVLGDDPNFPASPADYLSLPLDSFITVGFTDEIIIDGAGDDLFILEVGDALESADIFVSSTLSTSPADFVFLGQADGNTLSSFDLASIGFAGQVRAVKIVSLSNGGAPGAPGFDLANVQALQFQVPEPGTLALLSLGLASLATGQRRRR